MWSTFWIGRVLRSTVAWSGRLSGTPSSRMSTSVEEEPRMLTVVSEPGPPEPLILSSGSTRRASATVRTPSRAISSAEIMLIEAGVVDGNCGRLPATSISGSSKVGGEGAGWAWAGITGTETKGKAGSSSKGRASRAPTRCHDRANILRPPVCGTRRKKPGPLRARGPTRHNAASVLFLSAEGHRTRSDGQVSWLRISAAPRLPGFPVAIGEATPRHSGGTTPALPPANLADGAPDFPFTPGRPGAPVRHGMKFDFEYR